MSDTAARRTVPQGHPCADCGSEAVVGWGQPPTWLCLTHFEDRMKGVGQIVRTLRGAFDGT